MNPSRLLAAGSPTRRASRTRSVSPPAPRMMPSRRRPQMEAARTRYVSPADIIRNVGRSIADDIQSAGFRGCAFLNAAAEYPDPGHPVHQAVLKHREWFLAEMTELFSGIGKIDPEPAARHFVMLRDGAMAAGCLTDPESICETFLRGIEGLLKYRSRQKQDV